MLPPLLIARLHIPPHKMGRIIPRFNLHHHLLRRPHPTLQHLRLPHLLEPHQSDLWERVDPQGLSTQFGGRASERGESDADRLGDADPLCTGLGSGEGGEGEGDRVGLGGGGGRTFEFGLFEDA